AATAGAAMRGSPATLAVLASLAMRPDLSIPIGACRYVILIEGRLQLAFLRSNVRPARSARSKLPPLALCRARPGRNHSSILSFKPGHLLIPDAARSRLGTHHRMPRYHVTARTGRT